MVDLADIYLSYNPADKRTVDALRKELRDGGLSVWHEDLSTLPSERERMERFANGLANVRFVAICIGRAGFDQAQRFELKETAERAERNDDFRYAAVLLPDLPADFSATTLPDGLGRRPWIDLRTGIASIRTYLDQLREHPVDLPPTPPRSPDPDDSDLSSSVRSAVAQASGMVSAHDLATNIFRSHAEYGGGRAATMTPTASTSALPSRAAADWVTDVRSLYTPQPPGQLDGRKLVVGLALLDGDLRIQLNADEFLRTLEREVPKLEDALSRRGRVLRRADAVPTLTDEPASTDLLGRKAFAEALATRLHDEYIRSKARSGGEKAESFILHLEGPWGSGKTTLLGFIRDDLRNRTPRWTVVEFDAWRHQRAGAPWWLLFTSVTQAAIREAGRPRVRWRIRWLTTYWRLLLIKTELLALLAGILVVGLLWSTGQLSKGDPLGVIAGALASIVAVAGGLQGLVRTSTAASKRGADAFLEQTRDPLATLADRFGHVIRILNHPVAIFIDNLDRCQSAYVVDMLEGIQTVLRDAPVAYVIAADRHWLYQSYLKVYEGYEEGVEPGRPLGHLFLEKSFQLSTTVPRLTAEDQQAYWDRLLAPDGTDEAAVAPETLSAIEDAFAERVTEGAIYQELDKWDRSPAEQRLARAAAVRRLSAPELEQHTEHTLTRFAPLLEPNPRAMKRLLNAYGVERAVQILEGHPRDLEDPRDTLALWVVLKSRWPLLADYLASNPHAISDIAAGSVPAELTDDTRAYLSALFRDVTVRRVVNGDGLDARLDERSLVLLLNGASAEERAFE